MEQTTVSIPQQATKLAEETITWSRDHMQLLMTSYLAQALPSLDFITSVRCIVTRGHEILVIRDPENTHIHPGGRRETGETLLQTLQREILEETGWTLQDISLLGFKHFHHLTPKPAHYPYPYPDFFQALYYAQAGIFIQEAKDKHGYELSATFHSITTVKTLPLTQGEKKYLTYIGA
jgi:8-oxo-dGTP pyrophosphatase MutT (NUDIX family)